MFRLPIHTGVFVSANWPTLPTTEVERSFPNTSRLVCFSVNLNGTAPVALLKPPSAPGSNGGNLTYNFLSTHGTLAMGELPVHRLQVLEREISNPMILSSTNSTILIS